MGVWASNSCIFFAFPNGPETIRSYGVLGGLFYHSFPLSFLFSFFAPFMIPRALDFHVASYNSNIPREMQMNTFF